MDGISATNLVMVLVPGDSARLLRDWLQHSYHISYNILIVNRALCREQLEQLDISFCRGIPAKGLGLLADSCPNLSQLRVFGCSQVTPDFLFGHSNENLQVVGCSLQASPNPTPARLDLVLTA